MHLLVAGFLLFTMSAGAEDRALPPHTFNPNTIRGFEVRAEVDSAVTERLTYRRGEPVTHSIDRIERLDANGSHKGHHTATFLNTLVAESRSAEEVVFVLGSKEEPRFSIVINLADYAATVTQLNSTAKPLAWKLVRLQSESDGFAPLIRQRFILRVKGVRDYSLVKPPSIREMARNWFRVRALAKRVRAWIAKNDLTRQGVYLAHRNLEMNLSGEVLVRMPVYLRDQLQADIGKSVQDITDGNIKFYIEPVRWETTCADAVAEAAEEEHWEAFEARHRQ